MNKSKLFMAVMISAITIPAMVASVPADANEAAKVSIEQQVAQATNAATENRAVSAVAVKSFKDVSKNSPYYKVINEMAGLKIISGYEDNTFRPNEVITRKHAAALVNRAKSLPQTVKYVKFKDVSEKSPNFNDIKALQQAGIFTPDAKGNFNPDKALTRAEMAKVLVMAFDLEVKAVHNFPDVPTNSAYSKYVQAIYSNGITTGDDGKFLPGESLSRAHYAVFMHRAMNMDENFVAPPIVKPTPPVVKPPVVKPPVVTPDPKPGTGGNGLDTGLITDKYADVFTDVPKPSGYVSGTHEKKREQEKQELSKKLQFGAAGAFAVDTIKTKGEIEKKSQTFGVTTKALTDIINNAITTGDLYNGGNFVLYYDYNRAQVIYGVK